MENTGPGYGTDINVPVYATVKGVSIDNVFFVCFFARVGQYLYDVMIINLVKSDRQ